MIREQYLSEMTLEKAIDEVQKFDFSGIYIWKMGKEYMGCLCKSHQPLYNTNLWNYASSVQEAMVQLIEKAERIYISKKQMMEEDIDG